MNTEDQPIALNEHLQAFAHEIGIICALEAGGKISPEEAYKKIKNKWKELKTKKKAENKPSN